LPFTASTTVAVATAFPISTCSLLDDSSCLAPLHLAPLPRHARAYRLLLYTERRVFRRRGRVGDDARADAGEWKATGASREGSLNSKSYVAGHALCRSRSTVSV
jgi:hypothetical protein